MIVLPWVSMMFLVYFELQWLKVAAFQCSFQSPLHICLFFNQKFSPYILTVHVKGKRIIIWKGYFCYATIQNIKQKKKRNDDWPVKDLNFHKLYFQELSYNDHFANYSAVLCVASWAAPWSQAGYLKAVSGVRSCCGSSRVFAGEWIPFASSTARAYVRVNAQTYTHTHTRPSAL